MRRSAGSTASIAVHEEETRVWQHNYEPVAASLGASALAAVVPIVVLFMLLGPLRRQAWQAAVAALAAALIVAVTVYGMPLSLALRSAAYGAAYGMFPIAWIVFASIMLYRVAVDAGKFEIIKRSVASLTDDRRLQALFIAFSFGAFIEGAAGFGAPVAVSGAMLAGLGFSPFYAAGLCLLANTAPVAFGSIGIPVLTLANVTGLPLLPLSAMIGRLCAMVSIVIPAYLIVVMAGWRRALEVWPAIVACGVSFAGVQFYVSNYVGPELTDIFSSLTCIIVMALVLKYWKPRSIMRHDAPGSPHTAVIDRPFDVVMAWMPYLLLVVFVLAWGDASIKGAIDRWTDGFIPMSFPKAPTGLNGLVVPGLHNVIMRMPPVVAEPSPYAATFTFNWLSASGTACLLAILATAVVFRLRPAHLVRAYVVTMKQLKFALVTIAAMLAVSYLMNYSGMTSTLGLVLAGTGDLFPFFSAIVGWMGVFLTGSDTSANALFGNLQVVTAQALNLNPILTASVNSAAGVVGKMISIQSIAVAVAATGMSREDESRLFRFTFKHSVLLLVAMGIVSMLYAHTFAHLVPTVPPR
jgi:lactate permease